MQRHFLLFKLHRVEQISQNYLLTWGVVWKGGKRTRKGNLGTRLTEESFATPEVIEATKSPGSI